MIFFWDSNLMRREACHTAGTIICTITHWSSMSFLDERISMAVCQGAVVVNYFVGDGKKRFMTAVSSA
jgi:hypothetical protein